MLLFDKFNKHKTIRNAKILLSKCRLFRNVLGDCFKYKILQDYMFEISLCDIENNKQTDIAIQSQIVLLDVFKAINKLSNATYRRLLYEKFIRKNNDKDLYIASKLNMSEREFYRMLDLALLEFSEVYNFGELMVFEKE